MREVHEETSLDISKLINPDWYVEGQWKNSHTGGKTRLYIIKDVSMGINLAPRTKKEIICCEWFSLNDLFLAKRGINGRTGFKVTSNAFFMAKHLDTFLRNNNFVNIYKPRFKRICETRRH